MISDDSNFTTISKVFEMQATEYYTKKFTFNITVI